MKLRGFEVAKGFNPDEINLPKRATTNAAGYDFEASSDIIIPSMLNTEVSELIKLWEENGSETTQSEIKKKLKPVLVPTGVKAYMGENEVLQLANRSGNPLKAHIYLANGIGVIDGDYYENESNDGHIMFQFINLGYSDYVIRKGDRIGQGVFMPFLIADNDDVTTIRTGGFGSSGK